MGNTQEQNSQMTIAELTEFSRKLAKAIAHLAEGDKTRAAVRDALSAECVQCGIRISGADILKFPTDEEDDTPRIERLRAGYCGRNGCESLFYRVTLGVHPDLNWPSLLNPAEDLAKAEADAAAQAARVASAAHRKKMILRYSVAAAALLAAIIVRQVYMGGRIPFLREPENFRVDRNPEAAAEQPVESVPAKRGQVDPRVEDFKVDRGTSRR